MILADKVKINYYRLHREIEGAPVQLFGYRLQMGATVISCPYLFNSHQEAIRDAKAKMKGFGAV